MGILSCSTNKKDELVTVKLNYLDSPSTENCAQPFLFSNEDKIFMSWTYKENDSVANLHYSKLNDTLWATPQRIVKGVNWFVNWADFPAIAENKGNLLSHFLQKSADGTYTYDIRMKLFNNNSKEWQDDFILHDDGTKSEHGFVTILPYKNDSFFVTWLDGRNTNASEGHDHHGTGAMTIRAATILGNGMKENEVELDTKTCDCCQTSATITDKGPIVVYRDRSDDEIRDISITRLVDGQWTNPKAIFNDNWKIEGCPVNGPKAVSLKNNLAVAWYTEAGEIPRVKLIFSNDNGESFNDPVIIDEINPIGRVDAAFIDKNHVLVTWVTSENNETLIKAIKVDSTGKKSNSFKIATFDPSRSSGFPQLEILKDKAYFAWTDVTGKQTVLKTAFITLDNL